MQHVAVAVGECRHERQSGNAANLVVLYKIMNIAECLLHQQKVDIQHYDVRFVAYGIAPFVGRPAGRHPNKVASAVSSKQGHPANLLVVYLDEDAIIGGADSDF